MVEFESEIYKSPKGQHTITIPTWTFKSKLLEYEKDKKYKIIIEKIKE